MGRNGQEVCQGAEGGPGQKEVEEVRRTRGLSGGCLQGVNTQKGKR